MESYSCQKNQDVKKIPYLISFEVSVTAQKHFESATPKFGIFFFFNFFMPKTKYFD